MELDDRQNIARSSLVRLAAYELSFVSVGIVRLVADTLLVRHGGDRDGRRERKRAQGENQDASDRLPESKCEIFQRRGPGMGQGARAATESLRTFILELCEQDSTSEMATTHETVDSPSKRLVCENQSEILCELFLVFPRLSTERSLDDSRLTFLQLSKRGIDVSHLSGPCENWRDSPHRDHLVVDCLVDEEARDVDLSNRKE